ncbi:MAG TPA: hypothetical protein VF459_09365 [Caulobacteraceae bacterium]
MIRPPVPRHEPEVIAAEARRHWDGDPEKVATTALRSLRVAGVELSSRYDKAHEYETMAAMVEGLAPDLRPLIKSIFCDSKAAAAYSVALHACLDGQAVEIALQLEQVCLDRDGGHNGLYLEGPEPRQLTVAPRRREQDNE